MLNTTIFQNTQLATGIFEMVLRFDAGVQSFQPGQFAHVKVPGSEATLLRRPISVNHIDVGEGSATLVYQVKGEGTRLLAKAVPGERLDVLAPLGRGFWKPEGLKKAALVGGGIGAAPLRMLAETWTDVVFDAYLGFRGEQYAYQRKEFAAVCQPLHLCSDDGSLGEQNFVTCLLDEDFDSQNYDAIFACGPTPMLKALQALIKDKGTTSPEGQCRGGTPHCQVSLEERMGCGIGACLVCNCKILDNGQWHYRRVCKDGPVFEIGEVDFNG